MTKSLISGKNITDLKMPRINKTMKASDNFTSKSISHPYSLLTLKNVNKSIDVPKNMDFDTSNHFSQRKKYS